VVQYVARVRPVASFRLAGPLPIDRGAPRPESRLSCEKLDQMTEAEANARFGVALPLLEVASSARDPEVRKFLNFAPTADVRDHMVDVPSARPALGDLPTLAANVAATLGRSPDCFDLGPREAPLTRVDYDGSGKCLAVRFASRVPAGVEGSDRWQFAVVVVLQGISKRVPLVADCEGIPLPGDR